MSDDDPFVLTKAEYSEIVRRLPRHVWDDYGIEEAEAQTMFAYALGCLTNGSPGSGTGQYAREPHVRSRAIARVVRGVVTLSLCCPRSA